jgi:ATP-dependent Lhr-like helicase
VRAIVDRLRSRPDRRAGGARKRGSTARAPAGRWSLFPGPLADNQRDEYVERWCQLLLNRYGVLFRELLSRESAAPPWHALVSVLRRLEWRGELRGGRFVAGVAGEQFASETAIKLLRAVRDEPANDQRRQRWVALAAADPLNLVGIVTPGRRIAASHKAALILQNGRCVGVKQAGAVTCDASVAVGQRAEMEYALRRC